MEAYTSFSQVYDMFMDNIPYNEWCEYLDKVLEEYGVKKDDLVLDLGCGTGSVTKRLYNMGYSMIGIDNSEDMLSIAKDSSSDDILYLLQDMREFELYGTVKAVVSICDSINYIMSKEELIEVFKLVNNYLDARGIFIFDMNTVYKYKEILSDNVIAENREEGSFIWENYYYEEEKVNEYELTLYIKENLDNNVNNDNGFKRYQETHYQKAYTLDEIKEIINLSGMEFVTAYDAFSYEKVRQDSERICVIAREKKVEGKLYCS